MVVATVSLDGPAVVKPLVSAGIHEVAQCLAKHYNRHSDLLWLYQVKLSTIINSTTLRDQTVGLALCHTPEPNRPARRSDAEKHLLVAIDLEEDASQEKASLFADLGIPYVPIADPLDCNTIITEVDRATSNPRSSSRENSQLKRAELDAYLLLNAKLRAHDLCYLPEVSLDDALFLGLDERQQMRAAAQAIKQQHPSWSVGPEPDHYFNVDGIVATSSPVAVPVFFVELDGRIHRAANEEGRARRAKDGIKNAIFSRAQVPLIRIAVQNDSISDRYALDFLAELGPVLARRVTDTEAYGMALLRAADNEIRMLRKERPVAAKNISRLHEYTRNWYEGRLREMAAPAQSEYSYDDWLEYAEATDEDDPRDVEMDRIMKDAYRDVGIRDTLQKLRHLMNPTSTAQDIRSFISDYTDSAGPSLYYPHAEIDSRAIHGMQETRIKCYILARDTELGLPSVELKDLELSIQIFGPEYVTEIVRETARRFVTRFVVSPSNYGQLRELLMPKFAELTAKLEKQLQQP